VALFLVTRHLLVALVPGRVDIDVLGGERARVPEYEGGHPRTDDHLPHGMHLSRAASRWAGMISGPTIAPSRLPEGLRDDKVSGVGG